MGKRIVGDVYLRRFNTVDISKDDEGAQEFLMQVYKDKDVLLDSYKQTGGRSFTERNDFPQVQVNTQTYTHTHTHTIRFCEMPQINKYLSFISVLGTASENWGVNQHSDIEPNDMYTFSL